MAGKHDREGGTAADVQEEILAAACSALDKAHDLTGKPSFKFKDKGHFRPRNDWMVSPFKTVTKCLLRVRAGA